MLKGKEGTKKENKGVYSYEVQLGESNKEREKERAKRTFIKKKKNEN